MSARAAPSVVLVFGNARIEVDAAVASRRGGLRAFTREAEQSLALTPDSYSFFSAFGKVDTCQALQRALASATDGVCTLEIRERPEAKLAREGMRQAAFEARIMAKVDGALADIQQQVTLSEAKLCRSVAPIVQNVAMEVIDLRAKMELLQAMAMEQIDVRAKLDVVDAMQTEHIDVTAKLDAVEFVNTSQVSLLQCVAAEQIDLRTHVETMASDALAARIDSVAGLDELLAKTKEMENALSFQKDHLTRLEAQAALFCKEKAGAGTRQDDAAVQAETETVDELRKPRVVSNMNFASAWSIDFDLAAGAMPYSNKAAPCSSKTLSVKLGDARKASWEPSMMAAPSRGSFRAGRLLGSQSLPLLEPLQ
jgi:hypothetical protein